MKRTFLALTLFLTACNGATVGPAPNADPRAADGSTSPAPVAPTAPVTPPLEACNGLDDDADSNTSELGVCRAACTSNAARSVSLELPTASSVTVAPDSGETRELTAFATIPDFCTQAPEGVTRVGDVVDVGCGSVLTVGSRGLDATSLRIAAGGIVRLDGNTILSLTDTVLVCPGATIQGGADAVRERPAIEGALDAHDLGIRARVLVNLGTIDLRGGHVIGDDRARAGNGGGLIISVDRLLHAGLIDNSSGSRFNHGESGGSFSIVAKKESFMSGYITSIGGGPGYIDVPVL